MSAAIRVFHGVVQQIAEDLREPHRIRVNQHRRVRQSDAQKNPRRVDHFLVEVYRAIDDSHEVKRLLSQLDLAMADTRDVEQIVDEPHEMLDLPLHHLCARSVYGPCPLVLRSTCKPLRMGVSGLRNSWIRLR